MKRILLVGGTTEARELAQLLQTLPVAATVCVATDYGKELLDGLEGVEVLEGRLNREQLTGLLKEQGYSLAIDATHPYAVEVTDNLKAACGAAKVEYLRLLRPHAPLPGARQFANIQKLVEYLSATEGNILLATGSKTLEQFTAVRDYAQRIYPRVLPDAQVIEKCASLGYLRSHLICMQGPFGVDLNLAMLRQFDIQILVTKESGATGGFPEKLEAAKAHGAVLAVLERPAEEEGMALAQLTELLQKRYSI